MSDMTRAVILTGLNLVLLLFGIGIVCWVGYQFWSDRIFMGPVLVAIVTWVVLYLLRRWINMPFVREEAASRARRAAKGG